MGNAQSAESPRRPSQKLSKPKTGSHATAGLLRSGSFSSSSRRPSNAPLPDPPVLFSPSVPTPTTSSAAAGACAGADGRIDSGVSFNSALGPQGERKRRSLFRSRSSRGASDPLRRNRSIGRGTRMLDRLTRANSLTYESAVAYYGQAASDR